MRIVHLCLCGPVTDGWNYQDNLLTKYHKKIGHEVTIITSKWIWGTDGKMTIDDREEYQNDDGVNIIRLDIKGKNNFNNRFKRYSGIYDSLEKCKPDILFVHGCQFIDIKKVVKYIKNNKVIVYVDNHGDFSNSATNWISKNILHKIIWRKYANLIEPYTLKFYGVLPARVDFLKEMYRLPDDKVELLVMGADDEKIEKFKNSNNKQKIRDKHSISNDDFLIITGGKIDNAKKQTLHLMEAVSNINNEDIKLLVFGSVAKEIKDEFELLLKSPNIQYIGWLSSDDSYKYILASDLAVFPGRHSVIWEQTVGCGIPSLFKYWSGTQHVNLGGNCDFLYEDSSEEIKRKIEYIYNNKDIYNKMKYISEVKGIKSFSYLDIAKRSIDIAEEITK